MSLDYFRVELGPEPMLWRYDREFGAHPGSFKGRTLRVDLTSNGKRFTCHEMLWRYDTLTDCQVDRLMAQVADQLKRAIQQAKEESA